MKMAYVYWPVEYAVDAIKAMYDIESEAPVYLFQSPQFSSRSTLVKWLLHLCEQFKLGHSTSHLAVKILDTFMDGHDILVERLNIAALACLQLAAKYEERDVSVPKISELSALANNEYQRADFVLFEGFILKYLDWKLSLPTAIKFVEYFSLVSVSRSEWDAQKYASYEQLWHEVQQAIKDYLCISLQDARMLRFKPSKIACSAIILARRQVGVKPLWTHRLTRLTRYKPNELSACVNVLLTCSLISSVTSKRKLTESPDQGYVTEDSSNMTPPPKKSRSWPDK